MTTPLTPPADEPLVHDVDSTEDAPTYTRESLGDALGRANHVAWEARQERDALLADHARLTAEVARLRAFKLHAASCYNSWANGDTSPYAAVAALEAIGDELGEPGWEP